MIDGESWFSLFDDAMISLRYAKNLAAGHGLVWNPGSEPVEGYTNFLWTVLLAVPHALPVPASKVPLAVMLLGGGFLLATGAATWALAKDLAGRDATTVAAVATLCTGLYYALAYWTLRGLEVGMLAFLVVAGARCAVRLREDPGRDPDRRWLHALIVLALLTRPDAIVAVVVLVGFLAIGRNRLRTAAPFAATAVATVLAHTVFRLAYYGDPLPNTYYLKVAGVPTADRWGRGVAVFGELVRYHLWPLCAVLLAWLGAARGRIGAGPGLLVALFAAQCAYSIAVGGDAWEWMDYANRFVSIAVPGAFVVAAVAFERAARRLPAARPAVVVLLGAALLVRLDWIPVAQWAADGPFHAANDAFMTRQGLELAAATDPGAVIAVVWAGAVPYWSERRAVDLLGKNDRVVAHGPAHGPHTPGHDKWNVRHSVATLRPDVVFQTSHVWVEPGFWNVLHEAGYERLPNGIVVRKDSELVDREALAAMDPPDL